MAIYYLDVKNISRNGAGSAVAAAAYRHGTSMKNKIDGITKNYSGKAKEVTHKEIMVPRGAPDWVHAAYGLENEDGLDATGVSEKLWNDLEERELRSNRRATAVVAKSFTIALPAELSHDQQIALARDFLEKALCARGAIVDWVVHSKEGNPHIHAMASTRILEADGFGLKNRVLFDRSTLHNLRFSWAEIANHHLSMAGLEVRIDHRTLVDQGIELKPVSFSEDVARGVEKGGEVYRVKQRSKEARLFNEQYLMEHPEHALVLMSSVNPVFCREDLEGEIKKRVGFVSSAQVDAMVDAALASSSAVGLGRVDALDRALYTTKALVEMEQKMLVQARELAGSKLTSSGYDGVVPLLDKSLSSEQRQAVEAMISPCRLTAITGYAGSGKSYAFREAARVWHQRGFKVLGAAISGKGTEELSEIKSISLGTLAQWEARWDRGDVPPEGRFVMFVDEAGMVGASVWSRIQERVHAMGGKLIVGGDAAQLQPVADVSAFSQVVEAVGDVKVGQIRRQLKPEDRRASWLLAQGGRSNFAGAFKIYRDQGAINIAEERGGAIAHLAQDYWGGAAYSDRLALAFLNADVHALNAAIRKEGKRRGVISEEGEIGFSIGCGEVLALAKGDRVRFVRPWKEVSVTKGSFASVVAVGDASIVLSVDGGGTISLPAEKADFLDYGFATTIHKSQGMTVKGDVSVLLSSHLNRHLLYVAMSRHTESLRLYAPSEDLGKVSSLVNQALRSDELSIGDREQDDAHGYPRFGAASAVYDIAQRADMGPAAPAHRVDLAGDAHLMRVGSRAAGLLRAEWRAGDAVFADDPRGYVSDPLKVVDDLLSERSVLRASDVASQLSAVVNDPDVFLRLYAQAMSHPDLVVLDEFGLQGEGRVYTSRARFDLEAGLMDRAVALACRQAGTHLSDAVVDHKILDLGLSEAQGQALKYALWPGRIGLLDAERSGDLLDVYQALHELSVEQGARSIVIGHPARGFASELAAHMNVDQLNVYQLSQQVRERALKLTDRDVLIVSDASSLSAEDVDALLSISEQTGAKLLLQRDALAEGRGAIWRHLSARLPVSAIEDMQVPAERKWSELRSALRGAGDPAQIFNALHQSGSLHGADTQSMRIEEFAMRYVEDRSVDKVGFATSHAARHDLNAAIADMLAEQLGSDDTRRIDNSGDRSLLLHVGGQVVVAKSDKTLGLDAGTRARVVGLGEGFVEIAVQERILKLTDLQAGILDHAYVVHSGDNIGQRVKNSHVYITPGASREALRNILSSHTEDIDVSIPVAADRAGSFFETVLARHERAGVLDYGFDPSKALLAAAEAYRAPSAQADKPMRSEDREALALTHDFYRAKPDFFAEAFVRRQNRFSEQDVRLEVMRVFKDASDTFDPDSFVRSVLSAPCVVEVGVDVESGDALYSTHSQISSEADLIAKSLGLAGSKVSSDQLDLALPADSDVLALMNMRRLGLVELAGGDRARVLGSAADRWKAEGTKVIGVSISKQGAQRLGEDLGIEALTFAALEAAWARGGYPKDDNFVLVFDEAGQAEAAVWRSLVSKTESLGGKLVAVRDQTSLSPIGSLDIFKALRREIGAHHVSQWFAQELADERHASFSLLEGHGPAAEALALYNAKGRVRFAAREDSARSAIARSYWSHGAAADSLIFVGSNAAVRQITHDVRAAGLANGHLSNEVSYGRFSLAVNDRVRFTKADSALGISLGSTARVTSLSTDQITLHLAGAGANSAEVVLPVSKLESITHDYAQTVHAGAARVVDHSYVLAAKFMDNELFATALSRHRKSVQLHVPQTAFRDYTRLEHAFSHSNALDDILDKAAGSHVSVVSDLDILSARNDRIAQSLPANTQGGMDAHILDIGSHFAGLLGLQFEDGMAIYAAHDPRGYGDNPYRVVEDLLNERSVIRARDVATELAKVIHEPTTFTRSFAQAMSHPDLVLLASEDIEGRGRVYSSGTHIQREAKLVDQLVSLSASKSEFMARERILRKATQTKYGPMSPDQERALRFAASDTRAAMITGVAGSGKSAVLKGVRDVYADQGWQVLGVALSASAAKGLEKNSDIKSYSLAGLEAGLKSGRIALNSKSLLVVDEAAMLSAQNYEGVLNAALSSGASLRLVGDGGQIQPYGPGGMWRAFEARIGSVVLDRVWRQADPADQRATVDLMHGGDRARAALDHYAAKGAIVAAGENEDNHFLETVRGYIYDRSADKVVLAHSNAAVAELNKRIRIAEKMRRLEKTDVLEFKDGNDKTLELQKGDWIVFRQNNHALGITNGTRANVIGVNTKRGSFDVQVGFGDERQIKKIGLSDFKSIEYGYAVTTDRMQGSKASSVHAHITPGLDHSRLYVMASRHVNGVKFYVGQGEEITAKQALEKIAMKQSPAQSVMNPEFGFSMQDSFTQSFESQAQSPDARSSQGALGQFLAAHTDNKFAQNAAKFASWFSGHEGEKLFVEGSDLRALGAVIESNSLHHAQRMAGDEQQAVASLLRMAAQVDPLPKNERPAHYPARAEENARLWTGCGVDDPVLPHARVLSRALSIAEHKGDTQNADHLKTALELVAVQAIEAREEGRYDALLEQASKPVQASLDHLVQNVEASVPVQRKAARRSPPRAYSMFNMPYDWSLDREARSALRIMKKQLSPSSVKRAVHNIDAFKATQKDMQLATGQVARSDAMNVEAQSLMEPKVATSTAERMNAMNAFLGGKITEDDFTRRLGVGRLDYVTDVDFNGEVALAYHKRKISAALYNKILEVKEPIAQTTEERLSAMKVFLDGKINETTFTKRLGVGRSDYVTDLDFNGEVFMAFTKGKISKGLLDKIFEREVPEPMGSEKQVQENFNKPPVFDTEEIARVMRSNVAPEDNSRKAAISLAALIRQSDGFNDNLKSKDLIEGVYKVLDAVNRLSLPESEESKAFAKASADLRHERDITRKELGEVDACEEIIDTFIIEGEIANYDPRDEDGRARKVINKLQDQRRDGLPESPWVTPTEADKLAAKLHYSESEYLEAVDPDKTVRKALIKAIAYDKAAPVETIFKQRGDVLDILNAGGLPEEPDGTKQLAKEYDLRVKLASFFEVNEIVAMADEKQDLPNSLKDKLTLPREDLAGLVQNIAGGARYDKLPSLKELRLRNRWVAQSLDQSPGMDMGW